MIRSIAAGARALLMLSAALALAACSLASQPLAATQAQASCEAFNSWVWAQTVLDDNPGAASGLDPDRDGLACEELPDGIAPALWSDAVPADAIPVDLIAVNDGDTIEVWVDNRAERVRLVGIDTHEVSGGYRQEECYGPEASRFMKALMAVGGDLWIEQDVEDRDQYGRLLRWVWADFGTGEVYLLNEALLRAGYAERYRNTPNDRYLPQLLDAEAFAQEYQLGLWGACDMPAQASASGGNTSGLTRLPTVPAGSSAPAAAAAPTAAPSSSASTGCDPAYPDVCIPPYPPDLSCQDIPYDHIRVLPPDPHGFDGNHDGIGCEGPPA